MITKKYIYAIWKRKTAVAQVRLFDWEWDSLINGLNFRQYIKRNDLFKILMSPLKLLNSEGKYYFEVKVIWSWESAQIQAIKLWLARALAKTDEAVKNSLRLNWFLTRDSRKVERKKPWLHKARKASQWSKR